MIDAVSARILWATALTVGHDVSICGPYQPRAWSRGIEPTFIVAEAERRRAAPPGKLDAYESCFCALQLCATITPEATPRQSMPRPAAGARRQLRTGEGGVRLLPGDAPFQGW